MATRGGGGNNIKRNSPQSTTDAVVTRCKSALMSRQLRSKDKMKASEVISGGHTSDNTSCTNRRSNKITLKPVHKLKRIDIMDVKKIPTKSQSKRKQQLPVKQSTPLEITEVNPSSAQRVKRRVIKSKSRSKHSFKQNSDDMSSDDIGNMSDTDLNEILMCPSPVWWEDQDDIDFMRYVRSSFVKPVILINKNIRESINSVQTNNNIETIISNIKCRKNSSCSIDEQHLDITSHNTTREQQQNQDGNNIIGTIQSNPTQTIYQVDVTARREHETTKTRLYKLNDIYKKLTIDNQDSSNDLTKLKRKHSTEDEEDTKRLNTNKSKVIVTDTRKEGSVVSKHTEDNLDFREPVSSDKLKMSEPNTQCTEQQLITENQERECLNRSYSSEYIVEYLEESFEDVSEHSMEVLDEELLYNDWQVNDGGGSNKEHVGDINTSEQSNINNESKSKNLLNVLHEATIQSDSVVHLDNTVAFRQIQHGQSGCTTVVICVQ